MFENNEILYFGFCFIFILTQWNVGFFSILNVFFFRFSFFLPHFFPFLYFIFPLLEHQQSRRLRLLVQVHKAIMIIASTCSRWWSILFKNPTLGQISTLNRRWYFCFLITAVNIIFTFNSSSVRREGLQSVSNYTYFYTTASTEFIHKGGKINSGAPLWSSCHTFRREYHRLNYSRMHLRIKIQLNITLTYRYQHVAWVNNLPSERVISN